MIKMEHTLTVQQIIEILQKFPGHLPVEICNHYTGQLSYVDQIDLYDENCSQYSSQDNDYPMVVIHTETWYSTENNEK